MKSSPALVSLFVLALAGTTSAQMECYLGARIYPLQFIGSTNTMEFRTSFKSNCIPYSTVNFFVLSYKENSMLTAKRHPRKVILTLFKRHKFIFDFQSKSKLSRTIGKFKDVLYTKFKMPLSSASAVISSMESNNVILRSPKKQYLKEGEIRGIMMQQNPVLCKVSKDKSLLICNIN